MYLFKGLKFNYISIEIKCFRHMSTKNKTCPSWDDDKMFKQRKLATELLKKRIYDQKRGKNLVLNNASIRILGDGTQGSFPSLLLNSEGKSYLFNCRPGLQRFCFSNGIKLTNLENIFLTQLSSDNLSGIYGLALTLQDIGSPGLCVHSSLGIEGLFQATNSFMIFNTGIECKTKVYPPGDYSDSGMRAEPIIIEHTNSQSEFPKELLASNQPLIAYACKLPDLPGSLNPQKCKELKVPVGPQLSILKSGKDIQLADGTIVRSVEVCGPKIIGQYFIVIECPSDDHLEWLKNSSRLNYLRKMSRETDEHQLDFVIHLGPYETLNGNLYQEWMGQFQPDTKHFLIHGKNPEMINLLDCTRHQYLLHKIDPNIFASPQLPESISRLIETESIQTKSQPEADTALDYHSEHKLVLVDEYESLGNHTELRSLDKLTIRPKKILETPEKKIDLDLVFRQAIASEDFNHIYEDITSQIDSLPPTKEYEPELVFLGTGSAIPSKYRNTSGILFNITYPRDFSVILDCGEDTYGQLYRMYGKTDSDRILRQLKVIFITHHHADHHIGLSQLLSKRKLVTNEPILLLLPPGVDNILEYHNDNVENISSLYKTFSTRYLKTKPGDGNTYLNHVFGRKSDIQSMTDGLIERIDAVQVDHCVHACGFVISFKIGHPDMQSFTLTYSGDCRPSENLAKAGANCDLLIHEATMDHRGQDDAVMKKHSTTHEAIDISRKMGAKFTVLTHFSQKYPKTPLFTEEFDEKIGYAFDNLKLRCPSHFPRLPKLKPLFKEIFKDSFVDIETRYLRSQASKDQIMNAMQSASQSM